MRRTFFSFKYADVSRAMVVRNSWVTKDRVARGFFDAAEFETLKKQGDRAITTWIDGQLENTSVTVVLVGANTCDSRWVEYEIEESIDRGNGLIGVDVSKVKDLRVNTTSRCARIPEGYPFYMWNNDEGYKNLGAWIEAAARAAGR